MSSNHRNRRKLYPAEKIGQVINPGKDAGLHRALQQTGAIPSLWIPGLPMPKEQPVPNPVQGLPQDTTSHGKLGYELVEGAGDRAGNKHSFRIRGVQGNVLAGMDCPMWFPTVEGARKAAEDLFKVVLDMLKRMGIKAQRG